MTYISDACLRIDGHPFLSLTLICATRIPFSATNNSSLPTPAPLIPWLASAVFSRASPMPRRAGSPMVRHSCAVTSFTAYFDCLDVYPNTLDVHTKLKLLVARNCRQYLPSSPMPQRKGHSMVRHRRHRLSSSLIPIEEPSRPSLRQPSMLRLEAH